MALAPVPIVLSSSRRVSLAALPRWWHLLSLDAPTVAALWSWSLAQAVGMRLPLTSPLLLALGTWLVYVADRILDGITAASPGTLRERHFFYARHRAVFLAAAFPAGLLLLWLIAARMNPAARREDVAIFAIALVYFGVIHIYGPAAERWLPKELAVGVVFAAATAVPAWSRISRAHAGGALPAPALLAAAALFLAALCWLNCVAIEKWERLADAPDASHLPHRSTLWAQRHLQRLCLGIAIAAGVLAAAGWMAGWPRATLSVFLAFAMTGLSLRGLDRRQQSHRPSAFSLRIAADAVLLTPLLFCLLRG